MNGLRISKSWESFGKECRGKGSSHLSCHCFCQLLWFGQIKRSVSFHSSLKSFQETFCCWFKEFTITLVLVLVVVDGRRGLFFFFFFFLTWLYYCLVWLLICFLWLSRWLFCFLWFSSFLWIFCPVDFVLSLQKNKSPAWFSTMIFLLFFFRRVSLFVFFLF